MSRSVWLFWVIVLLLLIFLKNRQAVLLLPQQSAVQFASSPCKQAILEDIAASSLTFVISWSTSSRASASGYKGAEFNGLAALAREYSQEPTVRALIDAKGASCSSLPPQLSGWWQTGRLHCVHGPNRAAREAHTVLRFAEELYDHLPAVVVFLQDDPDSAVLRSAGVGTAEWLEAMRHSHVARLGGARAEVPHRSRRTNQKMQKLFNSSRDSAGRIWLPSELWTLQPCPCWVEVERVAPEVYARSCRQGDCQGFARAEAGLTPRNYGQWRTVRWWLRTFVDSRALLRRDTAVRGALVEVQESLASLVWPQHAQFAVTREAIRMRSRGWWAMNRALAAPAAPLKESRAREPGEEQRSCSAWKERKTGWVCLQTAREKTSKWANFGPFTVDLGAVPAKSEVAADRREAAHGMDIAQMFERLWFVIFDPLVAERWPSQHPECYTDEALAEGPVRCGEACPHAPSPPGCALSDRLRASRPPIDWRFGPGRRHCLADGCLVLAGDVDERDGPTLPLPADLCNSSRSACAMREVAWHSGIAQCSAKR